ncbi:MAG: methyltransferase domain-containing protein [Pseudanabaenaceae cyanobacterium bins.68]|nr:methyltransferase domain-containing protein [Pseudanabaenaceae cyanobacterium bins.68]
MSTSIDCRILFISHSQKRCGVYQYGLNIAKALEKSGRYLFKYSECSGSNDFINAVSEVRPSAIIYNYYPSTLSWLNKSIISRIKVPHLGIIHEVTQGVADSLDNELFDYHIAPDPTLLLKNNIVFKTGRLIPTYENNFDLPQIPKIGSFGFGLQGKGFEHLIATIQQEYNEAEIRLHIPFAAFGDNDGVQARTIAQHCAQLIVNPKIKLSVSHKFLPQSELLDFLAQNTLNAFFYEKYYGRGISSVIDYALAVQRPIAITRSNMFRHIISKSDNSPSICIENSELKQIIANGTTPLKSFCKEWDETNLIWDYERIIDIVLNNPPSRPKVSSFKDRVKYLVKKTLGLKPLRNQNKWIRESDIEYLAYTSSLPKNYKPTEITDVECFNRILDDSARKQYQPIIVFLFAVVPEIMSQKIAEANVQQAFVLDTVLKFSRQLCLPKILCVGSYEDTAAAGIKKLGYLIEEIDPVINYDLNVFFYKPSTIKNSYDIIFSTSVIEHVENDELFITQIVSLLAPGGTAILTCDYNDQYKVGDPIPDVDFRFYTQKDFKERFLPLLKDCFWVDEPQWDCPNPDFTYAGTYRYTFATLVFQKKK